MVTLSSVVVVALGTLALAGLVLAVVLPLVLTTQATQWLPANFAARPAPTTAKATSAPTSAPSSAPTTAKGTSGKATTAKGVTTAGGSTTAPASITIFRVKFDDVQLHSAPGDFNLISPDRFIDSTEVVEVVDRKVSTGLGTLFGQIRRCGRAVDPSDEEWIQSTVCDAVCACALTRSLVAVEFLTPAPAGTACPKP